MESLIMFLVLCSTYTARSEEGVHLTTGLRITPVDKILHEASTSLIYTVTIPNITSFLSAYTCTHDEDECEIFDHVKKLTEDTLKMLEHTLPQAVDLNLLPKPRKTRALDFIATAGRWCCGFARAQDVRGLTQRHEDLQKMAETLRAQITSQHDSAVKQTTLINQYSKEMQQLIETEYNKNTRFQLQTVKQAGELGARMSALTDSTSILAKLVHRQAIGLYWVKFMTQCNNKQLPGVLVMNDTLKRDLLELQRDLLLHDKDLAIHTNDLQTYFHLRNTVCYVSDQSVIIHTKIPIITKGSTYKLFTITPIPLFYNTKICSISIKDHLIARRNGKELIPLSGIQAQLCANDDICYIGKYPAFLSHDLHCLELAFSGSATSKAIRDTCPIQCTKFNNEKPFVMQLSHKEFAIIHPNNTLNISCTNKTDKVISTKDQVGALVINLLCSCHINIDHQKISADFPCQQDVKEDIAVTHTIAAS